MPAKLRTERRVAIVHTIHGPPFHDQLPWHTNRPYIAAERYAAKRCDAIVAVANAMVEQFLVRSIGKPEQYHTVYSGMETATYLTAVPGELRDEVHTRLGFVPSDFVIGTVARLAEHKGHDDVLDALADDLKANPNWKLLWVGLMGGGVSVDREDTRIGDRRRRTRLSHRLTPSPSPPSQLILNCLVPPESIPGLRCAMDVLGFTRAIARACRTPCRRRCYAAPARSPTTPTGHPRCARR